MITQIKLMVGAAIIAALIGLGFWGYHSIYQTGKAAGAAEVQTAWDADKAAISEVAAKALAEATKQRDDALSANEVIHNDYQTQLLSAHALNGELAQRLRGAESRAATNRGTVPKASDQQGSPRAPLDDGVGALNDALGSALNECYANRLRQSALIRQITPQL